VCLACFCFASTEETASLLTDLATLEAKKNTHIVAPLTMNKETQQVRAINRSADTVQQPQPRQLVLIC